MRFWEIFPLTYYKYIRIIPNLIVFDNLKGAGF